MRKFIPGYCKDTICSLVMNANIIDLGEKKNDLQNLKYNMEFKFSHLVTMLVNDGCSLIPGCKARKKLKVCTI